MSKHCSPRPTLLTYLYSLPYGSVLLPFCILGKTVVKSGLMDQKGDLLAIVHYVLAWVGVSGVEDSAEAVSVASLFV